MTEGSSHLANWLKTWWFLIAAGLGGAGVLITLWFDVQFIRGVINPERAKVFASERAVSAFQTKARWCIIQASIEDGVVPVDKVLKCLERP